MNTFSNLLPWNVFSFSLEEKKLIEDWFESFDQFDFIKVLLELIDSHDRNRYDFFSALWTSAPVFVISVVSHFVEIREELSQLFANKEVRKDEDLIMSPYFVKGWDKGMGILAQLIKRSEFSAHILINENLYIFPNELVDLYFLFGGGFDQNSKIVDVSK